MNTWGHSRSRIPANRDLPGAPDDEGLGDERDGRLSGDGENIAGGVRKNELFEYFCRV